MDGFLRWMLSGGYKRTTLLYDGHVSMVDVEWFLGGVGARYFYTTIALLNYATERFVITLEAYRNSHRADGVF